MGERAFRQRDLSSVGLLESDGDARRLHHLAFITFLL